MISLQALRVSPFSLGVGTLLVFLALGTSQGFGGEVAIWREIAVRGQGLADQLLEPVAEMTQELTSLGCNQFSLAYWSEDMPTRLRLEVRCRNWMQDLPLDATVPVGLASHEPTAAGSPR